MSPWERRRSARDCVNPSKKSTPLAGDGEVSPVFPDNVACSTKKQPGTFLQCLLLLVILLQDLLDLLEGLLDPLCPFTRRLGDALADLVAYSLDRLHRCREGLGHALGP